MTLREIGAPTKMALPNFQRFHLCLFFVELHFRFPGDCRKRPYDATMYTAQLFVYFPDSSKNVARQSDIVYPYFYARQQCVSVDSLSKTTDVSMLGDIADFATA